MNLEVFFWRHAPAEAHHPLGDVHRALTPRGHRQAQQSATVLARVLRGRKMPYQLVTSPAVRAVQTARCLSDAVIFDETLLPEANGDAYVQAMTRHALPAHALILVGHQPSIGDAIAYCLGAPTLNLSVRKSAVWWLSVREGRSVQVRGVWCGEDVLA